MAKLTNQWNDRNLRRRIQQPGESFNNFLVGLRELSKTCNFCNEQCVQKNLCDQIIEGTSDGDTIEQLLKQPDLTLDTAVAICRAQKAAKRQRKHMNNQATGAILVVKQQRRQQPTSQPNPQHPTTCPGCGYKPHVGGRARCPAYDQVCLYCNKIGHFARVCRAKAQSVSQQFSGQRPPPNPSTRSLLTEDTQPSQLSTIRQVSATEPAPTVVVHIQSTNGSCKIQALPDSGADITAAGPQILKSLGEHTSNLLSSDITSQAANGQKMKPLGNLPITFQLQGQTHREDMHIYPEISGVIMSWKATEGLNILPVHYPNPIPAAVPNTTSALTPRDVKNVSAVSLSQTPPEMIKTFSSAFDGQIRIMQGEEYHIIIVSNKHQAFLRKHTKNNPIRVPGQVEG